MSDDQIIALLTEIRDLQKQSAENNKVAMQRQQESMELQKQHVAACNRSLPSGREWSS